MHQISNHIFCDDFVFNVTQNPLLMPSAYEDYPYLLIPDFFDTLQTSLIMDEVHQSLINTKKAAQIKISKQGAYIPKLQKEIRHTQTLELSDTILSSYFDAFAKIQKTIEAFFCAPLSTASHPQGLFYEQGGFYMPHADDSSMVLDSDGETVGFKHVAPQRKITTIAFCNSHCDYDAKGFEGGEVVFSYLKTKNGERVRIKPKAGTLLAFPSNPLFVHEVTKVTQGQRFCIVQWHNAVL